MKVLINKMNEIISFEELALIGTLIISSIFVFIQIIKAFVYFML